MPFNIGGSELLLIFIVVLLVYGPGRLPEVFRAAGRTYRTIKRYADAMNREVHKAVVDLEMSDDASRVHPPGFDPVTNSVPYQEPEVPGRLTVGNFATPPKPPTVPSPAITPLEES